LLSPIGHPDYAKIKITVAAQKLKMPHSGVREALLAPAVDSALPDAARSSSSSGAAK
jgi:hypothetical protein